MEYDSFERYSKLFNEDNIIKCPVLKNNDNFILKTNKGMKCICGEEYAYHNMVYIYANNHLRIFNSLLYSAHDDCDKSTLINARKRIIINEQFIHIKYLLFKNFLIKDVLQTIVNIFYKIL